MTSHIPPNFSLVRYCRLQLGYDKVNVDEHGHVLNMLTTLSNQLPCMSAIAPKGQKIALLLLPRNSYKTTIASVSFPMWLLSRNPNLRVLVDSETYNLSKSIVSEIKQQYVSTGLVNPKETDRWAEDSIILPQRFIPKKEGSVNAAGVDGVKAGMHYDIIIADDLHSQNNTRNKSQIESVITHYRLLLSILDPDGVLVVIGTRWADEDAYTIIEKDANYKLFIPSTSTKPMNHKSVLYALTPEQVGKGESIMAYDPPTDNVQNVTEAYFNFPHTLSHNFLTTQQRRQGPYIYSAQYLLKPVAAKEKRFREEWLKFYTNKSESPTTPLSIEHVDLTSNQFRRVGLIDPAFTTSEYSDYTGIIVTASDHERNIYVKHAEEIKLEPFELIEHIFYLSEFHKVNEWYVEEVAAQRVLRFFMDYMASKEDKKLFVGPVKSLGRKKEQRIMSLQPYFHKGKIYLHKSQEALLDQLRRFPIVSNDDVLDALAYAPQVVFDGVKINPLTVKTEYTFDDHLKMLKQNDYTGIRPRTYT